MRFLRRKGGVIGVVVAMVLVPVAAAGDAGWAGAADAKPMTPTANGLGRGFFGIDLADLGATGQLPQVDQLSQQLLSMAGDPNALATNGGDPILVPSGPLGIPGPAMDAYKKAAELLAGQQPNCHMPWYLLASIGRIESGHGNGGQVDAKGNMINKILGPLLNGDGGFAAIADTDHGAYDDNTQFDRAVGPMQFVPSTWEQYASDGNGDGVKNPQNFYDAALAAGKYLCSGGLDMANPQQRALAVFRYNHSESYVSTVLVWADAYMNNTVEIPAGTGTTDANVQNVGNTTTNTESVATTPPPPPPNSPSNPPGGGTETTVTIPGGSTPPSDPSDPPSDPSDPPSSPPSDPPSDPPSSPPSDPPPSSSSVTSKSTTPAQPPSGSTGGQGGESSSTQPSSTSQSAASQSAATGG